MLFLVWKSGKIRCCLRFSILYVSQVCSFWLTQGYTDYEMQREMSPAPDWMVQHMRKRRIRCNALECDAASAASQPSSWRSESGSASLPHGPEVSYGIPFRWSASR